MEKEWILVGLLLLIAVFALLLGRSKPPAYPYQKLALFTPAEQVFLRVLQDCINSRDIMIMGKVRLADLIGPLAELDSALKRQAFNKICAKHIDFVLCSAKTFDVLGVIELDDSSHQRADRQARDAFVDAALAAAGIRIIHIKTQRQYDVQSLQRQLGMVLDI
jgi:hypothetical protein